MPLQIAPLEIHPAGEVTAVRLAAAQAAMIESGRQVTLRLTSTHGEAARAQARLTNLSLFLSGLKNAAEQLSPAQCWERIWARILEPLLTPGPALPGPSG